jgi:hypothetical protein
MKIHRHQAAAALAGAMLIAGASAGCTPTFESARITPERLAPQGAGTAMIEAGDGIRELTRRVNWAGLEVAPVIQGF